MDIMKIQTLQERIANTEKKIERKRNTIAKKTEWIAKAAKKMETARLVVWAQHGIYGAGKDLDETFGLIETAEKAAEIYMKIAHLPLVNTITDSQMHLLEARFGVQARDGYLN